MTEKQQFPPYLSYRNNYPEGDMPYHAGRIDRVKTAGIPNQCGDTTVGPRISMLMGHSGDELPLLTPTVGSSLSGLEQDYARASWHDYLRGDNAQVIIQVLNRQEIDEELVGKVPSRLVVHKDLTTGEISCSPIDTYMQHHPVFGFPLYPVPEIEEQLYPGSVLAGDTVLAKPTAWTADDNWAFGREANVGLYSLFGTNEDSAIANRTVQRDFRSTRYTTIRIYADNTNYLLGIHDGNCLPVIGQKIKYKGLIALTRRRVKENGLIHRLKCKSNSERIPFDVPYYSETDCTVVSVEVYRKHDKPKTDYCPNSHNTFLDRLWRHNLAYYEEIIALDQTFKRQYGFNYPRTPEWHIMVTEAIRVTVARPGKSTEPDPTYHDKAATGYYIEIVTCAEVIPQIGHKGTGRQGEKFVISQFREPEGMLTDKWGRTAEFIFNPNAGVNRNIASMFYEPYAGDTIFHLHRKMKEIPDIEERKQFYLDGMALISERTYAKIMSRPLEQIQAHLDYVTSDACTGLQRVDEIGDEAVAAVGLQRVRTSKYAPPRSQCTFVADNGKKEYTRGDVRIAPKRVFMLNKTGEYSSACAIPARQITGVAIRVSSQDKRKTQISEQSSKDIGAAEFRNFMAVLPERVAMRLLKAGLSPAAIREGLRQVYDGKIKTNVNVDGYATRGSELLRVEFECWGFSLSDEPESKAELYEYEG